jgi:hypothetical protein
VSRASLFRLLGTSPGHFFGIVEVEGLGTDEGNLIGWQIVRLPSRTPGWLDVRIGDVVVAVNGLTVERPEDAQRVYETLRVASEVRIDLTRDGQPHSVRVEILDTGEPLPPAPEERGGGPTREPAEQEPGEPSPSDESTSEAAASSE